MLLRAVVVAVSCCALLPFMGCPDDVAGGGAADGTGKGGTEGEGEGEGGLGSEGEGEGAEGEGEGGGAEGEGEPLSARGRALFAEQVQPLLEQQCAPCHVGPRFAFASLVKSGSAFSDADTAQNHRAFLSLVSLDHPPRSRLFAKVLPADHPFHVEHGGGARLVPGDALDRALQSWIDVEKADLCPQCGLTSARAFVGYVEADRLSWGLSIDPIRRDHGLKGRARIKLQRLDPATLEQVGDAVDFLPESFCGTAADGVERCDFQSLSASHDGRQLVFECRLSLADAGATGGDWVNDTRWNLCIAGIDDDGRAVDPRFLLPASLRHRGDTVARSDPFGILGADGLPLKGPFDQHFRTRRKDDRTPVFSPDDSRVFYSSKAKDPRSNDDGVTAYHGDIHRNHILSVDVASGDRRTVYLNDGGEADWPFFLHNGNVAFHTWNLERMDRHLYTQSTPAGNMELPVLFGRTQGPNMWGEAFQAVDGRIVGMTGRRRSSVANYVVFVADHTLGAGADPGVVSHKIIDEQVFNEIADFPGGFCESPPDGPNCKVSRMSLDASWSPDGRAFVAHDPGTVYVQQGEDLFLSAAAGQNGGTIDEQLARLRTFTPAQMGISLLELNAPDGPGAPLPGRSGPGAPLPGRSGPGALTRVVEPAEGKLLRHPVWIGARSRPRVLPTTVDESRRDATLHIADVPLWMSFRFIDGVDKSFHQSVLDRIVAVRVLVKDAGGGACLNDARPYRFSVPAGGDDHPTALGINNATGYTRLIVPRQSGGDEFGDVPVQADRSVKIKVPAGKLLLVQGIDTDGQLVRQRERLFSLPPGADVDVSVKREQHEVQCASCHGQIEGRPFVGLFEQDVFPSAVFDFDTAAKRAPAVDVSDVSVSGVDVSFKGALRPLFDQKCISCHSGDPPAGELSLEGEFSTTGNFPKGRWAEGTLSNPSYRSFIPEAARVPSYTYSMAWSWVFQEDEAPYRQAYAELMGRHAPLADLMPWDPAYTSLFAHDGSRLLYLGGALDPNFGRSDKLGGLSSESFLVEVLSGRDVDPARTPRSAAQGGFDHTPLLTPAELRTVMAVIDTGFPYMIRCDDAVAPSGPNAGRPWGDAVATPTR